MTIKGISFKQDNGIQVNTDQYLILERVARIIMTFPGERVNNPEFGSLLEKYLFQRETVLEQHVKSELKAKIEKYEPRVYVSTSSVSYSEHTATVNINLIMKSDLTEFSFETVIGI